MTAGADAGHSASIRQLWADLGVNLDALLSHLSDLEQWDAEQFDVALQVMVIKFLMGVRAPYGDGTEDEKRAHRIRCFVDCDDSERFGSYLARFVQHGRLAVCDDGECERCADCAFFLILSRYGDPQREDVVRILAGLADERRLLHDVGVPRPSWLTFPRELWAEDEARKAELEREIAVRHAELEVLGQGFPAPEARKLVAIEAAK